MVQINNWRTISLKRNKQVFKIKHNSRITFLKRILIKTNIKELPQLLNELKGYMSVVRPRQPPVWEYKDFEKNEYR